MQLLHGDCLELMKEIPDRSIDVVLTDPPFSSGARGESGRSMRKSMTRAHAAEAWFGTDSLTTNGFLFLMRACALEWWRLLRPGGHVLCFIDWRMMPSLAAAVESADLRHTGLLVWDKTYFGMGKCFRNQHELILHFTKGLAVPQRSDVGNVFQCKPIRNGTHPTEKPVSLLERLLSVTCPLDGVVLDCFMGSGSTGEAAVQTGRDFIGIEKDAGYFAIAEKRIREAQPPLIGVA